MFIQILNDVMMFLIEQKKLGHDTININELIVYLKSLDNQTRTRILKGDK